MTPMMRGPPSTSIDAAEYAMLTARLEELKKEDDMNNGRFDPAIDPRVMTREHLLGMLRTTARLYLYDSHSPVICVPVRSKAAAEFLRDNVGGGIKAMPRVGGHDPFQWGIYGQPLADLVADFAGDLVGMHKAIFDKYGSMDFAHKPRPVWWEVTDNKPYKAPPKHAPLSEAAATIIAGARAMASITPDPALPPHWHAMLSSVRKAMAEYDATP